jgi:hypothetical protein
MSAADTTATSTTITSSEPVRGRRTMRVIFGLLLTMMTIQFFVAGYSIMSGEIGIHIGTGHLAQLIALAALIAAAIMRAGKWYVLASLLALVLLIVQMFLPEFKDDLPAVAALHVLVPLIVWSIAHTGFRRARELDGVSAVRIA